MDRFFETLIDTSLSNDQAHACGHLKILAISVKG